MTIIDKKELKQLVLDGITTKDLNDNYDYSGIKDMSSIFKNCKELETIPELDTKNVTTMFSMFLGCEALNPIPKLTTDKVKDMRFMFNGCKALKTIPELTTDNVKEMGFMFSGCTSLTDLPYLETKNVTQMAFMFQGCTSFSGDLSNWNVDNLNDVSNMFQDITINPSIFNWNLPSLTNYNFQKGLTKEDFNELKDTMLRLGDLSAFL